MKRTIQKILSSRPALTAVLWLRRQQDHAHLISGVPYQCQFPDALRVKDYLENDFKAQNDPHWRTFGFSAAKDVDYWARRGCGIACIKMITAYNGIPDSFAQLTKKGKNLGGYNVKLDRGWYYKPLCGLLREYGIGANSRSYLPITEIAYQLSRQNLAIASVNPQIIRDDEIVTSNEKSGHLVLIIGFKIYQGRIEGFYLHNPSGQTTEMQDTAFIPLELFKRAYGERGIVVKGKSASE